MAFCILPSIALLSMQLFGFSRGDSPDAALPSEPDLSGRVKKTFTIEEYEGWSMWMEEEIGYKVFVQRATWEQAEQICQEHYAHLSSVMSEEENNVI
ncbi:hypothetical protein COOONC_22989, partial [Cooperia oncophora]